MLKWKMKKPIIYLILILATIQIASALDMCGETREVNQNCTMLTPVVMDCVEFNYTIMNMTGGAAQGGNLTLVGNDIYSFNVTVGEGDYIVLLCDGTTREIKVNGDNMLIGVIIGMGIVAFFFLVFGLKLENNHFLLKLLLFFFAIYIIIMIPPTLQMGATVLLAKFSEVMVWFFRLFATYVFVYFVYSILKYYEVLPGK